MEPPARSASTERTGAGGPPFGPSRRASDLDDHPPPPATSTRSGSSNCCRSMTPIAQE